jgi:hypothetical protein
MVNTGTQTNSSFLLFHGLDLPLSGLNAYFCAIPWPIEMGPIASASQRRRIISHGYDDMLRCVVSKIVLPEDR